MKPSSNTNNASTSSSSDALNDGVNGPPSGFVLKLYQMVTDAPDDIVSWVSSGEAFRISDLQRLEDETLPCFFRHGRFQSLVRQLNFYNFRKVNRERTFWIYRHPLFHRDRSFDLHLLRRRTCPGVDGRKVTNSSNPSTSVVRRGSIEGGRDAVGEEAGGDEDIFCDEEKILNMESNKHDVSVETETGYYGNQREVNAVENYNSSAAMKQSALHLSEIKRRDSYQRKQHNFNNQYNETTNMDSEKTPSEFCNGENAIRKRKKSWHLSFPERATSDDIRSEISFDCGTVAETTMEKVAADQDKSSLNDGMQLDLSQPEESEEVDINKDQILSNTTLHKKTLTSLDRKQNRRDSVEQSQVVSQIAQKLQARMKLAEEERNYRFGKHRGGRGRRVERNFYGDTMRYHALTYDDEIMSEKDDGSSSSSSTKNAPVVTDDSDSSEDDIASLHVSASRKNLVANLRYLSTTQPDLFTPSPFPIRDPNVAAQIYQKLLFKLGNIPATVIHFCLMTPPSLEAEGNLKQMLHANPHLAADFEHYRSALVPHTCPDGYSNGPSRSSCDTPHFHTAVYSHTYGGDSGKGILRDFGAFALNLMDLLFSDIDLMGIPDSKNQKSYKSSLSALDREQAFVVQLCAKVWYDSSHIFS